MKRGIHIALALGMIALILGVGILGCSKPAPAPAPSPAPAPAPAPAPKPTPSPTAAPAPAPAPTTPKPTTPAATTPAPAPAPVIQMKFSHATGTTTLHHQISTQWAKLVEQYTNGRVKVEVFPGGQLATEDKIVSLLKLGAVQATFMYGTTMEAEVPQWAVFQLPFVFDTNPKDMTHYRKFVTGPGGQLVIKGVEADGLKQVAWGITDVGQSFFNNKKPVSKLEEAAGLKIRTAGGGTVQELLKAIGISPTTIASAETATALQTGVVDGVFTTPIYAYDMKWWMKYGLMTMIYIGGGPFNMDLAYFKKLPADIQDIIVNKVGPEMLDYQIALCTKEATAKVEAFEKNAGMQVQYLTPQERTRWETSFKPILDKFAAKGDGKAILDAAIAAKK